MTLVGRQFLDNIGDVGRMQFGQSLVGNLQLNPPRGVGLNQIDEVPGNAARGNLSKKHLQSRAWRHSAQQAADRTTGSDVNRMNP